MAEAEVRCFHPRGFPDSKAEIKTYWDNHKLLGSPTSPLPWNKKKRNKDKRVCKTSRASGSEVYEFAHLARLDKKWGEKNEKQRRERERNTVNLINDHWTGTSYVESKKVRFQVEQSKALDAIRREPAEERIARCAELFKKLENEDLKLNVPTRRISVSAPVSPRVSPRSSLAARSSTPQLLIDDDDDNSINNTAGLLSPEGLGRRRRRPKSAPNSPTRSSLLFSSPRSSVIGGDTDTSTSKDLPGDQAVVHVRNRRSSWVMASSSQRSQIVPVNLDAPDELFSQAHRFALPTTLKQVEYMKVNAGNCPARTGVLVFAVLLAWSESSLPRRTRWNAVAFIMSRTQLLTKRLTGYDTPYSYGTTELSEFDRERMNELRERSKHVLRSYVSGTKPASMEDPIPFRLPGYLEYNDPNNRKLKNVVGSVSAFKHQLKKEEEDEVDSAEAWHADSSATTSAYICEVSIRVVEQDVDTVVVLFKSNANVRYPRGITLKREYAHGVKGWQCNDFWKLLRHVHP